MPLSFPSSPTLNQQVTTGGRTYSWNGEAWELVGSGIAGPANSLSIGTVSTGATASATITGSAPSQVLSLVLPKGDKGDAGDKGDTGAAGGVTTLNGVTGAVSIVGGANVTVTTSAATITVAAGGGGGSFSWASVPASTASTGTAGDIAYDSQYLYVATATNTWRRVAMSLFGGDDYWSSVSLLLAFNGSGNTFTDLSSSPKTITVYGNVTQSSTQSKWGGKSLYLDGIGDYLSIASDAGFGFGIGDFTVEGWFYPTRSGSQETLVDTRSSDVAEGLWLGKSTGDAVRCYDGSSVRTGGSMNINAWNHIAWSRVAYDNQIYLNGTRVIQFSNSFNAGSSRPITIGSNVNATADQAQAYFDDIRITKGVGRYTGSSLTQPTAAFSDY